MDTLDSQQLTALKNKLITEQLRVKTPHAHDFTLDRNELIDGLDSASINLETSYIFRFQNRNTFYSRKVKDGLRRIEKGNYGICENCGDHISFERLKARPTAGLCIICKEEMERVEKRSISSR